MRFFSAGNRFIFTYILNGLVVFDGCIVLNIKEKTCLYDDMHYVRNDCRY